MNVKVVDSSVAVDHLRGVEGATSAFVASMKSDSGELVASEIVRYELLAGVRGRELPAVETFLSALIWMPVDEDIARRAAMLARRFQRSHSGIEPTDYLIAATAIALDADLLTTNVRHFPMIEGLQPAY